VAHDIDIDIDHPLPIYNVPGRGMVCRYCHELMLVGPHKYLDRVNEKLTGRYMITHSERQDWELDSNYELYFCPNNAKVWIVEPYQPKMYPVDPATGEIDTFGGMV
jgi:hypothetical protein